MFKQIQSLPMPAEAAALPAANDGAPAAVPPKVSQDVIDARQETQIWTIYALSPYLRTGNLKVSVRDGRATITGNVTDDINKDLAMRLALGVDGIKSIENQIDIVPVFVVPEQSADRSFGEVVDDTTVTSAVRSKLAWSRFADGLITDVSSARGNVSLSGTAITEEMKEAAGKLAMSTHGVRSVNNQLVVRANNPGVVSSIGSDFADGWITTKVRSTFMYSINVAASDISVTTQGGNVRLSGKVHGEAERALAVELAGNVRGVRSVDSSSLTM
jgi:osmotically-inducible protein OsmY